MNLKPGEIVPLRDLHRKLNLSQSSLPTSLDSVPKRLHFFGLLISYEELQMVGWKKEVLLVLTEGGVETLKISMWLDHQNPLGIRHVHKEEILGKMILVKNVCIKSFDYTDSTDLQFYGEMNPPDKAMHTILFPIVTGSTFAHFEMSNRPFTINESISMIPKILQNKTAVSEFPTFADNHQAIKKILETMRIYITCIAKDIQFGSPRNSMQKFINSQNSRPAFQSDNSILPIKTITRLRRRSRAWLLSYAQTIDWIRRTTNKHQ